MRATAEPCNTTILVKTNHSQPEPLSSIRGRKHLTINSHALGGKAYIHSQRSLSLPQLLCIVNLAELFVIVH